MVSLRKFLSKTEDVLSFYQARCFFGPLSDLYSIAGRNFNIDTYIDRQNGGQPLITTKSLIGELIDITNQEDCLPDEAKTQKYLQIDESIQSTGNLTSLLQ